MSNSGFINRLGVILRELFWTSRRDREAIAEETEELLKMSRLLKEEHEKIEKAKRLLFELEKRPDSDLEAISILKMQIAEKENVMKNFSKLDSGPA